MNDVLEVKQSIYNNPWYFGSRILGVVVKNGWERRQTSLLGVFVYLRMPAIIADAPAKEGQPVFSDAVGQVAGHWP